MKHIAAIPPAYRSRRRRRRSLAAYGFPYPPTARTITRQGSTRTDAYTYNNRSESPRRLVGGLDKPRSAFAPRGRAGNGVPASQLISDVVDGTGLNGWDYDNIGNRLVQQQGSACDTYTSNALNQYTAIEDETHDVFTPTYDDDGNQTRIKTGTGIWNVTYNAKNRPVLFIKDDNSVSVACTYDYMGRRATKVVTEHGQITTSHRFLYRGYLQVACCDRKRSTHPCLWLITWDPTQPIATRPLAIQKDSTWYTYGWDLTKNIWEAYNTSGYIGTAYTYTAYGQVTASGTVEQPIQWSSEYNDTELALVYYNYRHYNSVDGRWIGRDFIREHAFKSQYTFTSNAPSYTLDVWGLASQVALALPKNCSLCRDEVYIFIGGFADPSTEIMYNVYIEEKSKKPDSEYAYYHYDVDRSSIIKSITGYKKLCPKSKIVLIGHSYGGDTAMDIAERLPSNQKVILVTLDPVSNYDLFHLTKRVPESVEYWINSYVARGPQDWMPDLLPIAGQIIAGFVTLFSGAGVNNSIASLGGKWGYETSANTNLRFDYYGEVTHGDASKLLNGRNNKLGESASSRLEIILRNKK